MTEIFIEPEHIDLEQIFQISADVDFGNSDINFNGLESFTSPIKKKQPKKQVVEEIELRPKNKTNGTKLF